MTLVLNEIILLNGLKETLLIAAADRRISKQDGSYDSTRRKLFPINYLNGAISYFGLAIVFPKGQKEYLSSWLPNFIRRNSSAHSLKIFAERLYEELNQSVPPPILKTYPSGFHICGYNDIGYPDFWYLSNIGSLKDFKYIDLRAKYIPPSSHFLERDAKHSLNWDGENPLSIRNSIQTYRNGDFRAHVAAWELLDVIYSRLLQFPDFKQPKTTEDYRDYVKFKFEFIAYIYKNWAKKKIIARPIDVIVLSR